jgi:hypothetical protein
VKSVHALQKEVGSKIHSDFVDPKKIRSGLSLLSEGMTLIQKYELGESNRSDLDTRISDIQKKVERIRKVKAFFQGLSDEAAFPHARCLEEAQQVFEAMACIRKIPDAVIPWRQPRILAAGQMVRIKAWQDRAKPILETRKRLEVYFDLDQDVDVEHLREVATALISGGMFKTFKSIYRNAMDAYRALLRPEANPQGKIKETTLQLSERLNEWASYVEQVQTFENNAEAKTTFGPNFKGVDTDFNQACDTNAWSAQIRSEVGVKGDTFGESLLEFIFKASPENIKSAIASFEGARAQEVEELLRAAEFNNPHEFKDLEKEEEARYQELKRLSDVAVELGFYTGVPLKTFTDLHTMCEEVIFLINRMDSNPELKSWLKNDYQGSETDLSIIEQGIFYIQFIENSDLPDALKNVFLSAYGPQRYAENRALVSAALASLAAAKEQLQKLDLVTRGRVQSLAKGPIPDLLTKVQQACRQPGLLEPWIEYLRCERETRNAGLAHVLDFFERNSIPTAHYLIAYDLVFNSSLLKKAIGKPDTLWDRKAAPSKAAETVH